MTLFLLAVTCFAVSLLLVLEEPTAALPTLFILALGTLCLVFAGYFQLKELRKLGAAEAEESP